MADPKEQLRQVLDFMIANEIVMACLLQALAKNQPSLARAVAKDIRRQLETPEAKRHPGIGERAGQFAEMLESATAREPQ